MFQTNSSETPVTLRYPLPFPCSCLFQKCCYFPQPATMIHKGMGMVFTQYRLFKDVVWSWNVSLVHTHTYELAAGFTWLLEPTLLFSKIRAALNVTSAWQCCLSLVIFHLSASALWRREFQRLMTCWLKIFDLISDLILCFPTATFSSQFSYKSDYPHQNCQDRLESDMFHLSHFSLC